MSKLNKFLLLGVKENNMLGIQEMLINFLVARAQQLQRKDFNFIIIISFTKTDLNMRKDNSSSKN